MKWKSPQEYVLEAVRSNHAIVKIRHNAIDLRHDAIRFRDLKKFQTKNIADLVVQKKTLVEIVCTLEEVLVDLSLWLQFEYERKERIAKALQSLCKEHRFSKGSPLAKLDEDVTEYHVLRWILDGTHERLTKK